SASRADVRPQGAAVASACIALSDVPVTAWQALADRALSPNAFYQPAWARAVAHHSDGHAGVRALLAWDGSGGLIGLLPVVSAITALKLPAPVLVAWKAHAPLMTPLIDRDAADEAIAGL